MAVAQQERDPVARRPFPTVSGEIVSGNYFSFLEVVPLAGRRDCAVCDHLLQSR